MENLVFVTGNYGKYIYAKNTFLKENIDIDRYDIDFEEPNINDVEFIAKAKAKNAYDVLKKTCFACDAGFYIEDYPNNPGYPGAFVKRSNISSNVDNLLEIMKNVKNRKCKFVDCIAFYDGKKFHTFFGIREGTLAYKKSDKKTKESLSNLWYVFIPNNFDRTLGDMTDDEIRSNLDGHTSANKALVDWYKKEYLKEKVLKLK